MFCQELETLVTGESEIADLTSILIYFMIGRYFGTEPKTAERQVSQLSLNEGK